MMGEGYCYHLEEGKAAIEAAAMLRGVSDKPYWPLLGALPGDWSVAPPVVYVNMDTIDIIRWHHPSDADFAWYKYNLLEAVHKETGQPFHAIVVHGYTDDGDKRLADAKKLQRYGDGLNSYPCIVGGDWCSVPSGPMWEPQDLNDDILYDRPSSRMIRAAWHHGPYQAGPYSADTRSLDFLVGYYQTVEGTPWGQRIGGINFYDVAELMYNNRPTQLRKFAPDRRHTQALAYDRFLVNKYWKDRVVRYQVCEPLNPHPSDHLKIDTFVAVG
jgi:hypothetical protein